MTNVAVVALDKEFENVLKVMVVPDGDDFLTNVDFNELCEWVEEEGFDHFFIWYPSEDNSTDGGKFINEVKKKWDFIW